MNSNWKIIGQDKVIGLFERAVEHDVLAHAYLLVGPPQVGKLTLARELAKVLNCQAETAKRPCQECPACRKIADDKHCDVQVVGLGRAAEGDEGKERTEIGIEQIKDLLHSANLPPFEGRQRVYIIDEAGNLSADAANRLLKTLEEPPAKVTFLLLTENAALIPATVISRCQRLNLARINTAELEEGLIAQQQIEPEKARLLARLSHGCAGWAIQAAGNPDFTEERREKFEKMKGLLAGDTTERFNAANQLAIQFARKRESVYETLDTWTGWWRDVLLVKSGCDRDIVSIDNQPALDEMAGAYTLEQIKTAIEKIVECRAQLKLNANARLALDVLMLNLPRRGPQRSNAGARGGNA